MAPKKPDPDTLTYAWAKDANIKNVPSELSSFCHGFEDKTFVAMHEGAVAGVVTFDAPNELSHVKVAREYRHPPLSTRLLTEALKAHFERHSRIRTLKLISYPMYTEGMSKTEETRRKASLDRWYEEIIGAEPTKSGTYTHKISRIEFMKRHFPKHPMARPQIRAGIKRMK